MKLKTLTGQFELVNFYLSLLLVELICLVFICLLQNPNNYDLFNMRSLQRVWRCRQTDLVRKKVVRKSVLGTALCHHETL